MKVIDFLRRGRQQGSDGLESPDSEAARILHELIHLAEDQDSYEMEAEMLHGKTLWHMVLHKVEEGDENNGGH